MRVSGFWFPNTAESALQSSAPHHITIGPFCDVDPKSG